MCVELIFSQFKSMSLPKESVSNVSVEKTE